VSERFPVITGVGVIAAPGSGVDEIWQVIAAGQSGLKPLSLFRSPRYGQVPVGEITRDLIALGAPHRASRSDQFAWLAARDAINDANLDLSSVGDRTGVVLGCSVGGSFGSERFLTALQKQNRMSPLATRFHECSSPVNVVADAFGCRGPSFAISTACSSGALAIAAAGDLIQSGAADVVLCGGADSLARTTWAGFHSLLLVDPQGCRPFDANRHGMSFGEGAAVIVVESEAHAAKRGAKIIARLTGWGASCDAHHATAPHPEGAGALAAMNAALHRARLDAGEIGYVNAHGTGTRDNDVAEGKALKTLFGGDVPAFSSTKQFFGHALAASGAIEAVVCIEALRRQRLPANPGFKEIDPAIGLAPVTQIRPADLTHVLSNSFGFGGNNAALVFSLPTTRPRTTPTPSRSVSIQSLGVIAPDSMCEKEIAPPLPAGKVLSRVCGPFPDAAELSPIQRRRLSRIIQMSILATRRAGKPSPVSRVAIVIGTGFGCLDEGAVFLENVIAKDEAEPMPTRFPGSVHNAPAGQVAIDLGAHGLNSAPTMGEISFETALWQAMNQIAIGEADEAYAGAVDELNKYPLYIGNRWGLWSEKVVPGESCVVAKLSPMDQAGTALAHVTTIKLGRYRQPFDAVREADWIAESVEFSKVQIIVSGAGGWREMDSRYDAVLGELSRRSGHAPSRETYKQESGESYSASAFGFAKAVALARSRQATVLLYTLSARGSKALCLIQP